MQTLKQKLSTIKYMLLDMDGTLYLGDKKIGAAEKTLAALRSSGKKLIFLTNNSSKSAEVYKQKLQGMGLFDKSDAIYTSGMATAEYITANHAGKSVFLTGTPALVKEFERYSINLTVNENPDLAVLSYDTALTYQKKTLRFYKARYFGSFYIATHPDINCPAPGVYLPDVGSFIKLIEASTGKTPQVICGKPYRHMGDSVMRAFNAAPGQIMMAGDRLSTDIMFAKNNSFASLLVFSGETDEKMYSESGIKADYTLNSINDIINCL